LELSSAAGNVFVTAERLTGDTFLSTSAGNLELRAYDVQGNISAKSSMGTVRLQLPREVNCRIEPGRATMGSVSNQLVGNPSSPYVIKTSTSMGSVVLEAL